MNRWLSLNELALELNVSPTIIRNMLAAKTLVGIQTGNDGWRILDPAPALRAQILEPRLDTIPLISTAELSEVLGISPATILWHVHVKHLKATKTPGKATHLWFTARQVREFLARDKKGAGKHAYSPTIVKWVKRYVEELRPNGEILDELIKQAVPLPEPERSEKITKLWDLFDQVNALLKQCRK